MTQQLTEQQQMILLIESLIEAADEYAADLPDYFDPEMSFEEICSLHTESDDNRREISYLVKQYEAKYGPWEIEIDFPEDEQDEDVEDEEDDAIEGEVDEDENATIDLIFDEYEEDAIPYF